MKVAFAGAGASGEKHLDALGLFDGAEVVSAVGRRLEPTQAVTAKYGIGDSRRFTPSRQYIRGKIVHTANRDFVGWAQQVIDESTGSISR